MAKPGWEGRTLGGRYQIGELLGHGGMSSVYKAFDPNLKRDVAVKIIHTHLSDQPDFVERFEREAASVAQLRHPNIIQVHDFSHEDNIYYIVFEYIAGENLQDRLKRLSAANQYMPIAEVKKIMISLAGALDYAHSKGIVHRDIKPANVMLNESGEPILMDFGITKIIGGGKQTATGITLGTVQYMSPEQIKGLPVDARTDIYALGITLYEMLGGRSPFEGNSTMAVMMMHVQSPVPDPRMVRNTIPPVFVDILNRAMAKEPGERYQRAGDLARDMRWTQDEMMPLGATIVDYGGYQHVADADRTLLDVQEYGGQRRPAAPTEVVSYEPGVVEMGPSLAQKPQTARKKNLWLALGLVLVLLAVVAGGVWFFALRGPGVAERVAEAEALAAAGQYDEAIAAYEGILAEAPGEETAVAGLDAAILARAQAAINQGNDEEAEADLSRLLAGKPNDATLNMLMADLLARQERYADALPYYDAVIAQGDEAVEAHLGAGWAAYGLENYNRALEYFSEAVAIAPGNAEAYAGQGKSYVALGWYEDAVGPLRNWVEKRPVEAEPYLLLGMTYRNLGQDDEAISNYRRWLQLAPDSEDKVDAQINMAQALLNIENYREAIDVFTEIVQANPGLPAAYEGLGTAYWATGDQQQALQAYQEWVSLAPDSAAAYAAVGRVARDTGDLNLSIESYNLALSIEEQSNWYVGLGQALVSNEQYNEALLAYQRSWELDPEQVEAYRLAGWLNLQRIEDYEAAIVAFQRAASNAEEMGLTEADATIYVGLGTSFRSLGQHRQAIAPLRTALELSPNSVNVTRLMALSYFNLEDYQNAIVYFSRAIELEERPEFLAGLGQSYRLTGNCDAAIPLFERALALQPDHGGAADGLQRCQP